MLIYPRVVQLPPIDLPRGAAGGSAPRRRPLMGVLPAASVRDYSQGDSIRYVHWPTTAHRGQLMVKELELEPSGDVWIVVDLDAAIQRGEGPDGTLEYSIVLAASLAAEMVSGRHRRAVGLLAASGETVLALPPQPGQAQLWTIMAALAPAQVTPWPLAELLRRNRSSPGAPAYAGGDHGCGQRPPAAERRRRTARDGQWIAELVQAQRVGLASSVLFVTRAEEEAQCNRRCNQLVRLDIPAQVLRTDMPLRAALTYRRKRKVIRSTPTGGAFTVEVEEEVG